MVPSRWLKNIAPLGLLLALGACASGPAPTAAPMATTRLEARLDRPVEARLVLMLASGDEVLQTLSAAPGEPVTFSGLTPGRRYRVGARALSKAGEPLGEAEATVVAGAVETVVLTVHLTGGLTVTNGTIVDPTEPEAFL